MTDYTCVVPNFLAWVANSHPEAYENYTLTQIKINGKIAYWMSPAIQMLWEKYICVEYKTKQPKEY